MAKVTGAGLSLSATGAVSARSRPGYGPPCRPGARHDRCQAVSGRESRYVCFSAISAASPSAADKAVRWPGGQYLTRSRLRAELAGDLPPPAIAVGGSGWSPGRPLCFDVCTPSDVADRTRTDEVGFGPVSNDAHLARQALQQNAFWQPDASSPATISNVELISGRAIYSV
jgi:hypothetical protein